jgi:hypothetical protein
MIKHNSKYERRQQKEKRVVHLSIGIIHSCSTINSFDVYDIFMATTPIGAKAPQSLGKDPLQSSS